MLCIWYQASVLFVKCCLLCSGKIASSRFLSKRRVILVGFRKSENVLLNGRVILYQSIQWSDWPECFMQGCFTQTPLQFLAVQSTYTDGGWCMGGHFVNQFTGQPLYAILLRLCKTWTQSIETGRRKTGQKSKHNNHIYKQGCIFRLTCSHPELTEDHVLTSAYVKNLHEKCCK